MAADKRGFFDIQVVVHNGTVVRYEVIKDMVRDGDKLRAATLKEYTNYINTRDTAKGR